MKFNGVCNYDSEHVEVDLIASSCGIFKLQNPMWKMLW